MRPATPDDRPTFQARDPRESVSLDYDGPAHPAPAESVTLEVKSAPWEHDGDMMEELTIGPAVIAVHAVWVQTGVVLDRDAGIALGRSLLAQFQPEGGAE